MALVNCPECSKSISDSAASCPSCGHPMQTINAGVQQPKGVVTTQATAKRYKGLQLIGGGLFATGIVVIMAKEPVAGVVLSVVGLGVYFYARIGAWWNHG
ncbi:MAG TPA: zinc-ribbon domain-containing protein [Noviherbaspirillum sp.]|nr:zinc-ribbon domain-containing protein [Noviherbaspirillum sp.]